MRVVPVADSEVSIGWHGNAVLVDRSVSYYKIERMELPGLEPRGAVKVRVGREDRLEFVATHLGLMRRHRRRQLDVIASGLEDPETSLVVGDFNEWSATRGLEALTPTHAVMSPGRSFQR